MWAGVLLTFSIIAALLGFGGGFMVMFASGMSDSPQASKEAEPTMWGLYGLGLLGVVGIVIAIRMNQAA